jgi:hypothetical protein
MVAWEAVGWGGVIGATLRAARGDDNSGIAAGHLVHDVKRGRFLEGRQASELRRAPPLTLTLSP